METAEQARQKDDGMLKAWEGHPLHFRIKNGPGGFAAKLAETTAAVMSVAHGKHPQ